MEKQCGYVLRNGPWKDSEHIFGLTSTYLNTGFILPKLITIIIFSLKYITNQA